MSIGHHYIEIVLPILVNINIHTKMGIMLGAGSSCSYDAPPINLYWISTRCPHILACNSNIFKLLTSAPLLSIARNTMSKIYFATNGVSLSAKNDVCAVI